MLSNSAAEVAVLNYGLYETLDAIVKVKLSPLYLMELLGGRGGIVPTRS
jgi:hypothetical protein